MDAIHLTSRLFKSLMHPARLAILNVLRQGEQCVCHLEAVLGCRQAYISQHLMVLREMGLVVDRREGSRIYYKVIQPQVFELIDAASLMAGGRPASLPVEIVRGCPCPRCTGQEDSGE